jgi:hypothetical protein
MARGDLPGVVGTNCTDRAPASGGRSWLSARLVPVRHPRRITSSSCDSPTTRIATVNTVEVIAAAQKALAQTEQPRRLLAANRAHIAQAQKAQRIAAPALALAPVILKAQRVLAERHVQRRCERRTRLGNVTRWSPKRRGR